MLGLAAAAAIVAMAFVGATSASAVSTQLCKTHETIVCEEGQAATTVSMVNEGPGRLLTDLVDVICDSINATGTPLAAGAPQSIHVAELDFESCETNGGDGCEVSVLEQPLASLLSTGLDEGTLTGASGLTLVECEDVIFSTDIHCVYDSTALEFPVGAQHLTANETQVDFISGGGLCPDESLLDGLLVTTESAYVQVPGGETALCKTHTEKACKGQLVGSVHFVAKAPKWNLEKGKETVECEESILKGTVKALKIGQEITIDELKWVNCKLTFKGGEENCSVMTLTSGVWRVVQQGLNTGIVTPGSDVEIICKGKKIACKFRPKIMNIFGATGAENGKIVTTKEGGISIQDKTGGCPQSITWSASYGSVTEKIYVLE